MLVITTMIVTFLPQMVELLSLHIKTASIWFVVVNGAEPGDKTINKRLFESPIELDLEGEQVKRKNRESPLGNLERQHTMFLKRLKLHSWAFARRYTGGATADSMRCWLVSNLRWTEAKLIELRRGRRGVSQGCSM